jgi:hypothetical protein
MDGLGEITAATIRELLKPLVKYVGSAQKRKTLKHVGRLHFWSDGMLQQLTEIAEEHADAKTYRELGRKFRTSRNPVETSMDKLRAIRNDLGGGTVAIQIDQCIHNYDYGKMTIRDEIQMLLDNAKEPDNGGFARGICRQIEILNAELERLIRLVDAGR